MAHDLTGSSSPPPNGPAIIIAVTLLEAEARAEGFSLERFRDRLERRTRELVQDLGLPASAGVKVDTSSSLGEMGGPFVLEIDGIRARVDRLWDASYASGGISYHSERFESAEELAERVAEALYWNRVQLLTPGVVEVLDKRQRDEGAVRAAIDPRELGALLRHAVGRGLSVPLCFDVLRAWRRDGAPLPALDDDVLEALFTRRLPDHVSVECGRELYARLYEDATSGADAVPSGMVESATLLRNELFFETGVKFPPLRLELGHGLDGEQFRGRFGAIRGPVHEGLPAGEVLVNKSVGGLPKGMVGRAAPKLPSGAPACFVAAAHALKLAEAGYASWTHADHLLMRLSGDLRRHASTFLTRRYVEHVLSWLNASFPLLVFNIVERFRVRFVHRVLQELIEEGVSIRDLRTILEALLADRRPVVLDVVREVPAAPNGLQLVSTPIEVGAGVPNSAREVVRRALSRHLTGASGACRVTFWVFEVGPGTDRQMLQPATASPLTAEEHDRLCLGARVARDGVLRVVEVGPATEQRMLRSATAPLSAEERDRLCGALARFVVREGVAGVAVLTSPAIRRPTFEAIQGDLPGLAVLSRDELASDVHPMSVGRIEIYDA